MPIKEHTIDSNDCWCKPKFYVPCNECDGSGCWKCNKGLVQLSREAADVFGRPVIVVHNESTE